MNVGVGTNLFGGFFDMKNKSKKKKTNAGVSSLLGPLYYESIWNIWLVLSLSLRVWMMCVIIKQVNIFKSVSIDINIVVKHYMILFHCNSSCNIKTKWRRKRCALVLEVCTLLEDALTIPLTTGWRFSGVMQSIAIIKYKPILTIHITHARDFILQWKARLSNQIGGCSNFWDFAFVSLRVLHYILY